jgi:hypothetical protein
MTTTTDGPRPWEDESPMGRTLQWHREAAERDDVRLAEGPDDDTEHPESPWRDDLASSFAPATAHRDGAGDDD